LEELVNQLRVSSDQFFWYNKALRNWKAGLFFTVYDQNVSIFSLENPSGFDKIPLKDNRKDSSILGGRGINRYCSWDSTCSTKLSADLITDFLLAKVYSP